MGCQKLDGVDAGGKSRSHTHLEATLAWGGGDAASQPFVSNLAVKIK